MIQGVRRKEKMAALVLTHVDLDPLNNTGMSVEQLAQHFNGVHLLRHGFIFLGLTFNYTGRKEAMMRVNYFVWNQRRAHDTEGVEITFLVILPPPSGQVIQTYSDADTMLQFMGNDRDWHEALTYFQLMIQAANWRMCTLTVSLVGMQFPKFWFVAGRGNLALGALRGRGRGRGAVAVLSGPGGRCSGGRGALAALPGPVGRGPGGRGSLGALQMNYNVVTVVFNMFRM
ncbi:hypothetical protein Tco_0938012 [Tanacetum coccineum]|uniref:Uncharacterized protein n=1 Tax=Tanacetum coccineum TaxID=301880 RepID=A0ABQ5DIJ0_9ASTR